MTPRSQSHNPIERAWNRVETFLTHDIWQEGSPHTEDWPLGPLYRVLRVVQLALRGVLRNRATFTASALTFVTVLSLVPLLAFAFSVAKGVGGYERLRNQVIDPFLVSNLGPDTADAPQAIRSLHDAIDKVLELVSATDVGSLGALGLAVLVLAVIRVLSGVEDAFNRIWGAERARSWVRRLSDYISLAVATPLLVLLAVGFTTAAQNTALVQSIREQPALGDLLDTLFGLAPLISMWIGLTLLYLILPNTRVKPTSAALGGFVGAFLWQIAQIGHVEFQIGMANYNAIYASFAAFPIFLVWIYVSWVTVMFGAEFAHAHQSARHHRMLKNLDLDLRRKRDLLVLRGCVEVTAAFLNGRGPLRQDEAAEALDVPTSTLARELEPVVEAGLLVAATVDDDEAWTVGRQPSEITMSDVLAAVHGMNSRGDRKKDSVLAAYRTLLGSLTRSEANLDLDTLTRKTRDVDDDGGDDEG